jgi:putative endonuclease
VADARRATGEAGEAYVAGRLEREGFTILQRNWRVRGGEIDIIALDGDELVFVEVRVRAGQVGDAEGSVDGRKLATLLRAGRRYVHAHAEHEDRIWRIDLVAIDLALNKSVRSYRHYQNLTLE